MTFSFISVFLFVVINFLKPRTDLYNVWRKMYVYLNSLLFSNKCKPHQYTNGLDNGAGNNNAFCDDLKCIYPPPPPPVLKDLTMNVLNSMSSLVSLPAIIQQILQVCLLFAFNDSLLTCWIRCILVAQTLAVSDSFMWGVRKFTEECGGYNPATCTRTHTYIWNWNVIFCVPWHVFCMWRE